jgi:type IX secretion system PorP/SprF family membrane protein
MKKIIITAIVSVYMVGSAVAQQVPMYSQYMFNMMNINPAYTGSREVPTTTALFRRQWMDLPGAPTSGSITFDDRVNDRNHSWGAQMYYDKLGIERTTGVQGFYSYHAPFEKATLSLGMSFGMLNYSLNRNRTNPYDQGDPSLQSSISKILPTAGFGALLAGERWYVGLSAPALLKTRVMNDGTSIVRQAGADGHYFLTAGYVIPMSEAVTIKPSTLIKAVSGAPVQVDLNMNVWVNNTIGFGASYRTATSIVGLLELRVSDDLRLGYAYDHGSSKHLTYAAGTHEFMLRHELGGKQGKKIVSPRFF